MSAPQFPIAPSHIPHQEIMRCVIDDKQNVIFSSPSLSWQIGISTLDIMSSPIDKILTIVSGEHPVTENLNDLPSGFYDVALYHKDRDPLLLQSRIDNILLPGNRQYIVFSLDTETREDIDSSEDFHSTAQQLADIAHRFSNEAKGQQKSIFPQVKQISKTDGELRHFLNLSNDLLAVYRRDGSFIRVNYAFNRVLGYTDMDLRSIPFIDLIHSDDREFVCTYMKNLAFDEEEKRVDFECRARCKDGRYRWIEWIQKTTSDHIYIIGRDITDIKKHEAELDRREQQLSEAQKIGNMGHWYWVVKDTYIDWSDHLYDVFGVNKDNFIPTLANISALMPKEDANRVIKAYRKAIQTGDDCNLEFRIKDPQNSESYRYILSQGRCKLGEGTQKVKVFFGIMQDVTERRIYEEALKNAKESAESAYASKTRFLANMSHELRTPLNAIIGFSDMIGSQLLGPIGNDRYLDYISGIRESGGHLLTLINDILDMSKIEVGKYDLETEPLNVKKLIQLATHMMEGRAHESGIKLILENIADDINIIADRRAIIQVLLNLMSNAIKFTPESGSVTISCIKDTQNMIYITVLDTGVGIPKDKLETVLLPFEQVGGELTRNHEGSGLGLAITKDLITLHHGNLTLESTVGKGTKITVILPEDCHKS